MTDKKYIAPSIQECAMTNTLEQRARELLAEGHEHYYGKQTDYRVFANAVRRGEYDSTPEMHAVKAALRLSAGEGLVLNLCRDKHPPLVTRHGGMPVQLSSDWCVVVDAAGLVSTTRYSVMEGEVEHLRPNGGLSYKPWNAPGRGDVVAWVSCAEVKTHISAMLAAAPRHDTGEGS